MSEQIKDYDVVVAECRKRLEPLCAIYSKNCLRPIKRQLFRNNLKVTDFFGEVRVRIIREQEILEFDDKKKNFFNINTPSDYHRLKADFDKNFVLR